MGRQLADSANVKDCWVLLGMDTEIVIVRITASPLLVSRYLGSTAFEFVKNMDRRPYSQVYNPEAALFLQAEKSSMKSSRTKSRVQCVSRSPYYGFETILRQQGFGLPSQCPEYFEEGLCRACIVRVQTASMGT